MDRTHDRIILVISLILLSLGIVLVYSSSFAYANVMKNNSEYFLIKHAMRGVIAFFAFFLFMYIDYHKMEKIGGFLYILSVFLLLWVLVSPFGRSINGARRWIEWGFISFQASEFARAALLFFIARQCQKNHASLHDLKIYLRQVFFILVICGLIVIEPNMSTALILAVVSFVMLFVSGVQLKHLFLTLFALLVAAGIGLIAEPYRLKRVLEFIGVTNEKQGIGYQVHQSLIALGHGGIFGVGVGKGEQKFLHLPEAHTDFVISIYGEEFGFIGLCILMILISILLYRGMRIALHAPDIFGKVLATGITVVIGLYALIHVGVDTHLLPTTGIPFPFLSYGGMNLIFTMAGLGVLLNISKHCTFKHKIEKI